VVISGSIHGRIAINSVSTGLNIRLINDHCGAPMTTLACQKESVCIALVIFIVLE
jgi:hypothetical protein